MRNFIVGSDWWTDCDDAVAFRLLARAAAAGKIKICGIGINACMEDSAASLSAFLKNEGMMLPPIGIDRAATDFGGKPPYQERLAKLCMPRIENSNLEDAAELYIRLLKNGTEKYEIIEIGYPQVLAEVLRREPELFGEKVKKVWMMAGKWDEERGRENNFARNARSRTAAHYFCENCPCPVTFLGWEVACDILTGGFLKENDVLYGVLRDHGSINGRSSWDPMLVDLALIGDTASAGYGVVIGKASVDPLTGENRFAETPDGRHRYVVKEKNDEYYRRRIDNAIKSV